MRAVPSILTIAALLSAAPAKAVPYVLSDPSPAGSTSSYAYAIDDTGLIRGTFGSAEHPAGGYFFELAGHFDLFTLEGTNGYMNVKTVDLEAGLLTGEYEDASYITHSFVFARKTDGEWIQLPPGGALNCEITATRNGVTTGSFYRNGEGGTFLWQNGVFTEISEPGMSGLQIQMVTDSGYAVVTCTDADNHNHVFTWRDGTFTDLQPPGTHDLRIYSATQNMDPVSGQMVGTFYDAEGRQHSFHWKDGAFHDILPDGASSCGIIYNPQGMLAGSYPNANGRLNAFAWTDGVYTDLNSLLPADTQNGGSYVTQISPEGDVLGICFPPGKRQCAFLWSHGKITILGPENARENAAWFDANAGGIRGYFQDANFKDHSFFYSDGVLTDVTPPGMPAAGVTDYIGGGRWLGTFTDLSGRTQAYIWDNGAAVPLAPADSTGSYASIAGPGLVTGGFGTASGVTHAFIWKDGAWSDLTPDDATYCVILKTSTEGIVSGYTNNANYEIRAFVWKNGTFTTLLPEGATSSSITAINASGMVAGIFFRDHPGNSPQPFVWKDGVFTNILPPGASEAQIDSLSDAGLVQGKADGGVPFVWQESTGAQILAPTGTKRGSVNNLSSDGRMVGYYEGPDNRRHAFTWQGGLFLDLAPYLPSNAIMSDAVAINASGQIVGSYAGGDFVNHAFLLIPAGPLPSPTPISTPTTTPSPTPSDSPSPTPQPVEVEATSDDEPTPVRVLGKRSISTDKDKIHLKGRADSRVISVIYRVGKGPWNKAEGITHWHLDADLESGRNVITIITHSANGKSRPVKVVIFRK